MGFGIMGFEHALLKMKQMFAKSEKITIEFKEVGDLDLLKSVFSITEVTISDENGNSESFNLHGLCYSYQPNAEAIEFYTLMSLTRNFSYERLYQFCILSDEEKFNKQMKDFSSIFILMSKELLSELTYKDLVIKSNVLGYMQSLKKKNEED